MIAINGQIVARGTQFSLNDVEVVAATVDLEAVRAHRKVSSRSHQAAQAPVYERVHIATRLDGGKPIRMGEDETPEKGMKYHTPEEEIA
jgi:NAD+ synthase (glutamine-hydrolysing)